MYVPRGDAVSKCCTALQSHAPSVAVCCSAMWHTACFLFVSERQNALSSSTMPFVPFAHTQETCCVPNITITHGNTGYI